MPSSSSDDDFSDDQKVVAKPVKKKTKKRKKKKAVEEPVAPPERFVFASEAVCDGHPDKICDAVADAVVDSCLSQDRNSKVAVEVVIKKDVMMVFGEVVTAAAVNYEGLAREVVKELGYDDVSKGLDHKSMIVVVNVEFQSKDIAQGVYMDKKLEDLGAGDQGVVFGYAVDERDSEARDRDSMEDRIHHYMPTTLVLAHAMARRMGEARREGELPWLYPDGKVLVVMEYEKRVEKIHGTQTVTVPVATRCASITIAAQHPDEYGGAVLGLDAIKAGLVRAVIEPVVPKDLLRETIYYINPAGRFVVGGPLADAGMTGRKIEVDTYGGWCCQGGGSLAGKDPSKVDRSGACLARHIAKSIVHAQLCRRATVQISYAIGVPYPLQLSIDSHGTVISHGREKKTDRDLERLVTDTWDLRVGPAIRDLDLQAAVYERTSRFGHFGNSADPDLKWEVPRVLEDAG